MCIQRKTNYKIIIKTFAKNFILDNCQKTTFCFNSKLYEQFDCASMRRSLGPVLANIIMTECKKFIVEKLIKDNIIKSYTKYVDDTLLFINYILNQFNSFDENLKFTINTFDKFVFHFLNTEIYPNGLGVYHENTQTGQYVHTDSFTLWKW